jgi:hypothetical protein
MWNVESIVKDVATIYRKSGNEAVEYLGEARKLEETFGPGPAIIYCWFYSIPQKWTQVESKIFELMEHTDFFDLDTTISMQPEKIAAIVKPMIFRNEIASQLKNFCFAVRNQYCSWNRFAKVLKDESVFVIFSEIRKNRNVRVSFKNLAAMKSFVGMDDDLIILDTHVAKVLRINKDKLNKIRTNELLFRNLLETAKDITTELKKEFSDISSIKWSLAIWFNETKIKANSLLLSRQPW